MVPMFTGISQVLLASKTLMPGIICHFISYSMRVLNCDNGGFFSFAIAAINRVIQRARQTGRRSVISMSLIGPKLESIDIAIREAVANNIVVVTAAGNIFIRPMKLDLQFLAQNFEKMN